MIFKSAAVNPLHLFLYTKAGLTPKSASPAIAKSNKSNCLSTKLRRLIRSWNSELNYQNSPISRCPAALSLRDCSVNRIPFDLIILVLFFLFKQSFRHFSAYLQNLVGCKIHIDFCTEFFDYFMNFFQCATELPARFIISSLRHFPCRLFCIRFQFCSAFSFVMSQKLSALSSSERVR